MRRLALVLGLLSAASIGSAGHPPGYVQPVYPRIDVIGPVGNRLPPGYRRKYNRPSYLGGWIMSGIAPSSQEAMAWQKAVQQDAYKDKHTRQVMYYFFPKPWESLEVGPRTATADADGDPDYRRDSGESVMDDATEMEERGPQLVPNPELEQELAPRPPLGDPGKLDVPDLDPTEALDAPEVLDAPKALDAYEGLDAGTRRRPVRLPAVKPQAVQATLPRTPALVVPRASF